MNSNLGSWVERLLARGFASVVLAALFVSSCSKPGCEVTRTCAETRTEPNLTDAAVDGGSEVGTVTQPLLCPEGEHLCSGICVSSDGVFNCGVSCTPCEPPIDGSPSCNGIRCGGACGEGKKLCAGTCIDEGATCAASCPEGTHDCNGLCPSDSSVNACGTSCDPCPVPPGATQATCEDGVCGFVCSPGYHRCGDACRRDTDVDFCGPSCEPCAAIENGFPTCNNRVCTVWCGEGFHVCNEQCVRNDSPESCGTSCTPCVNPAGGSATCAVSEDEAGEVVGQCGVECPEGEVACAGVCISEEATCTETCPEGTRDCGGVCIEDGNPTGCGPECVTCGVPQGAREASCVDGVCGIAECRDSGGFRQCGNTCSLVDSPDACGPDCAQCPEVANSEASSCQSDQCSVICALGFHLCGDGLCHDNADTDFCGPQCVECEAPVGGSTSCNGTGCVPSCPNGMKVCLGACVANDVVCDGGCPEQTHSCGGFCRADDSVNSCGTRCEPCPAPPANGTVECVSGVCEIQCADDFHECSGLCVSVSDVNRCGEACSICTAPELSSPVCAAGECTTQCNGTVEVCDAAELDENCNGQGNEGCACIPEDTATCADVYANESPEGVCATRTITCQPTGQWPAFTAVCTPQTDEVCDAAELDEDCSGASNENCACTPDEESTCGEVYATSLGPCGALPIKCLSSGIWPSQASSCAPAARDCDSSDDNNCNGTPDNEETGSCACDPGTTRPCGTNGPAPCRQGTQACVTGTDAGGETSFFSTACTGAIDPVAELCTNAVDDDCDGVANDGCPCGTLQDNTSRSCGACGGGTEACNDGVLGACSQAATCDTCCGGTACIPVANQTNNQCDTGALQCGVCPMNQACQNGGCVNTCAGCIIGGQCVPAGPNPTNPCQICIAGDTSYSVNNGATCSDGDPCTNNDACNTAGVCGGIL